MRKLDSVVHFSHIQRLNFNCNGIQNGHSLPLVHHGSESFSPCFVSPRSTKEFQDFSGFKNVPINQLPSTFCCLMVGEAKTAISQPSQILDRVSKSLHLVLVLYLTDLHVFFECLLYSVAPGTSESTEGDK